MKSVKWSKDSLISLYQNLKKKLGLQPTKKQWLEDENTPSDMPIRSNFFNWTKFISECGDKPLKVIPVGARKGKKNKSGVKPIKTFHGYMHIFKPEHPLAVKNGYVREHRMLAYDAGILKITTDEIHHKNGIKTDNRLDNLEVLTKEKHASITWKGVKRSENGRQCKFCSTKTLSKYGLCRKHYKLEWQRGNILRKNYLDKHPHPLQKESK